MSKINKSNLTKKDIAINISQKIGVSNLYSEKIINDFIKILKILIKKKRLNIKNFGTFKILIKKEREGRNPKNNVLFKIDARKSLSFLTSKQLNKKINNN
tara:strand:- start:95 stop:394 length:300 start_codon:yes stop_codon:yes gene_type:complete